MRQKINTQPINMNSYSAMRDMEAARAEKNNNVKRIGLLNRNAIQM